MIGILQQNRFRNWIFICLLLVFSDIAHFARAQENAGEAGFGGNKVFQLDEIRVTAEELDRDIHTPNMDTVKPELFPMGITTTVDLALERQPGVDVQRIQEVGTATDDNSIRIRGFGARRVKAARDGRLLNTAGVAGGAFIDWTLIPLTNVERIEVIKGVADPRYGNVLGGVVNLVSKDPPRDAPVTEIAMTSASFDTWRMDAFHAWKPGAFEYAFSAGSQASDGYLRNGDLESGNLDLRLGYDFSGRTHLYADIAYRKLKKGFVVNNRQAGDPDDPRYDIPLDPAYPASDGEYMYGGMGAYPEPGSWWEKEKWLFDFGLEQDVGDTGEFFVRYWQNHGDREAFNTRAEDDRIYHKKFYDDRSWGVSGDYKQGLPYQTITLGADFDKLKDDGDTNYSDDFRAPFRKPYYVAAENLGIYVMDDIRMLDEMLWITPGVRYMRYDGKSGPSGIDKGVPDIEMDGWAPSLKITYNYRPNDLVYLSAARALRMPTPPEHYWHYDAVNAGADTSGLPFNKEDGLMLQAGWKTSFATETEIDISPYYYRIDDYIHFDLINFVSYNINRAELYGLEFQVSQELPGGFSAFANYTFQKSKTRGDPFVENFLAPADRDFDEIPGLPAHKGNFGLQYTAPGGGKIAVFLQAVSEQDVIYSQNTLNFPADPVLRVREQHGYMTLDLEGRYPIHENFKIGIFARNLMDEDYDERFGFPAAGRTLGITLRAEFR
ncbi:MAG: TonB-dependent receptor [Desulfobacteraceae bacterium]|nr:TonB-dependent receptor [Desulfobacteraceae bacterium]